MPKKQKPTPAQELKALQAKWYAKLKKSGFKDIEEQNSPHEMLKRWDGHWFQSRFQKQDGNKAHASKLVFDQLRFDAKQRYFELAADLLNSPYVEFTAKERKAWELHSQGYSLREIQKLTKYSSVHALHTVIKRFRKIIVCK